MNRKGFAPIAVVIFVAVLLIGGGAYVIVKHQQSQSDAPAASSTAIQEEEKIPPIATSSGEAPAQAPAQNFPKVPTQQTLRVRFTGPRFFDGYGISENREVSPVHASSTFRLRRDLPLRLGVISTNLDGGGPSDRLRKLEAASVSADGLLGEIDTFFQSGLDQFTSSPLTLLLPANPKVNSGWPPRIGTSTGFTLDFYSDGDKNGFYSADEIGLFAFKEFIHLFHFAEEPDAKSIREGARIGWNVVKYTWIPKTGNQQYDTVIIAYTQPFANPIDIGGIFDASEPVFSKEEAEAYVKLLNGH